MRKLVFLLSLIFSSCTPNPQLQSTRWTGDGVRPLLLTKNLQIEKKPAWKINNENVQISHQFVGQFKVEDSFIKTISQNNNDILFESSSLLRRVPPAVLAEAQVANQKKHAIWQQFKKEHSYYQDLKIVSPAEVLIAFVPKLKPVISILVESAQGNILAIKLDSKGRLLSVVKMGSGLSELQETPSLAYPKGPKKSQLTPVLLKHKIQLEGLADSFLEIFSLSPIKITGLSSLEYPPTDERFDQVQAFYFSQQILAWFQKKLLLQGPLKLSILTEVGYPEKTNAAFYFQNQIRLGAGDDVSFSKIPWDPSIVMHETSHAVIDALTQLPFQGEGGSINEGFADFFTTFYLDSPFLADSSYQKANYKRSVDQSLKLSERNGGLYHDSAIVSGFFWSAKKIIGSDKSLLLGVHVLNRLGPNSNFKDFILSLHEQSQALLNPDDLNKINSLMKDRELL